MICTSSILNEELENFQHIFVENSFLINVIERVISANVFSGLHVIVRLGNIHWTPYQISDVIEICSFANILLVITIINKIN